MTHDRRVLGETLETVPYVPQVMGTHDEEEGPTVRLCNEEGCDVDAAVRLYVPWGEDRELCPAHARPLSRKDGVVAEPLEGMKGQFP